MNFQAQKHKKLYLTHTLLKIKLNF